LCGQNATPYSAESMSWRISLPLGAIFQRVHGGNTFVLGLSRPAPRNWVYQLGGTGMTLNLAGPFPPLYVKPIVVGPQGTLQILWGLLLFRLDTSGWCLGFRFWDG